MIAAKSKYTLIDKNMKFYKIKIFVFLRPICFVFIKTAFSFDRYIQKKYLL